MQRIIFRADGGPAIGMGHVTRCLALADMLKDDFEITFAIHEPDISVLKNIGVITKSVIQLPEELNYSTDCDNFLEYLETSDIVVLDGYHFTTSYQEKIKSMGCKLVCVDDLHAWHQVSDVIINQAGVDRSVYSAESYTKFYTGLKYILLRKCFFETEKKRSKIEAIKKVFISMGAADARNLTQKFTEALLQVKEIEEIYLMLGAINPHLDNIEALVKEHPEKKIRMKINIPAEELKKILQQCDVAICPASSISLECCAVGIGLITGFSSDNQMGNLKGIVENQVGMNWGDLNILSEIDIRRNIEKLVKDPSKFNDLISNQKKMIDGKSPERLKTIFKKLVNKKISFRFANESDADLYFKWANDPVVRSNSYTQNEISHDDHVKWFKSKLKSGECFFYLFFDEENKPVGQVRIDKRGDESVIGISVDEAFRGMSMGVDLLKKACKDYFEKRPGAAIVAFIKAENIPSFNIFIKAGFKDPELVDEQSFKSYKLVRKK